MKRQLIWELFLLFYGIAMGWLMAMCVCNVAWQKSAYKSNIGYYKIISETGATEFRWGRNSNVD